VYDNNICTTNARGAGAKTVANGIAPNSDSLVFNTPGTYYWQAVYSGDQFNSSATSPCQGAILTVVATTTPPATTTPGTISGTVYNDANKNDVKDSTESGISGVTIWLHLGNKNDGYNNPIVMTTTSDASGHYSFANLVAGKYFVEESIPAGWKQTSDDTKVVVTASSTGKTVDFANVMKKNNNGNGTTTATSTDNGHHGDNDNDNDDNHGGKNNGKNNNGNHWGWLNNIFKNFDKKH